MPSNDVNVYPVLIYRKAGKAVRPKIPLSELGAEVDDIFALPPDSQRIWRYMDYSKFLDLLSSDALYCRRLDLLSDPFEGLLSHGNVSVSSDVFSALKRGYGAHGEPGQRLFQSHLRRQSLFVNCWHINDREERLMWQAYAPREHSVAVRSSIGNLMCYAGDYEKKLHVSLARVRYVDADTPRPDWHSEAPAYYKNMQFRFERELRVIAVPVRTDCESFPDGIRIRSLPVACLIDEVIIHPHARPGFLQMIQNRVRRHLPWTSLRASRISRLY